jgi:hypothetical protein
MKQTTMDTFLKTVDTSSGRAGPQEDPRRCLQKEVTALSAPGDCPVRQDGEMGDSDTDDPNPLSG